MNNDWSLNALIAHCDALIDADPHHISKYKSWKTACRSVISMQPADVQNDVRTVNIENAVQIYAGEKNPAEKTAREYRGRLKAAIESLTESMVESEPEITGTDPPAEEETQVLPAEKPARRRVSEVKTQPPSNTLTIPIRSDFLAQLILPYDLTPAEARRLCRLIEALPIEQDGETTQ